MLECGMFKVLTNKCSYLATETSRPTDGAHGHLSRATAGFEWPPVSRCVSLPTQRTTAGTVRATCSAPFYLHAIVYLDGPVKVELTLTSP